ncbi:hypothetical protein MYX07_02965 [Patescibacteria group bacterium AH-259-L07]|nr:hypothetical protein [Patescibacteria group bacterium AH-259-L07]
MTIEKEPQGEPTPEKTKITPLRLEMAANTHLEGTNMLEVLNRIKLGTDEEGNIKEHVVRSIKTMLRKAVEMTPDEVAKGKFQKMLDFMEEY